MLIAVEGSLDEAVARRILAVACPRIEVTQPFPLKGKTYLRSKAESLNRAAKGIPVLLLTDLDDPRECPAGLIRSWLKTPRHPESFLRVAVLETESWVMADREAFARFLSIPVERIPEEADSIPNPKEFLVSLARRSKSSRRRQALVPPPGGTSPVGPLYNPTLGEFVVNFWRPEVAAESSASLRRSLSRLRDWGAMRH